MARMMLLGSTSVVRYCRLTSVICPQNSLLKKSLISHHGYVRTLNSICELHTLLSGRVQLSYGCRFPCYQQTQSLIQVDRENPHQAAVPGLHWHMLAESLDNTDSPLSEASDVTPKACPESQHKARPHLSYAETLDRSDCMNMISEEVHYNRVRESIWSAQDDVSEHEDDPNFDNDPDVDATYQLGELHMESRDDQNVDFGGLDPLDCSDPTLADNDSTDQIHVVDIEDGCESPWSPQGDLSTDERPLPQKEQLILKILKKSAAKVDFKENTRSLLESVNYLETCGCHVHQIVECPELCGLSQEEINDRMEILHAMDIPVSVTFLNMAGKAKGRKLRTKISKYMKTIDGHISVAEWWREQLNADEDEMLELVANYGNRFITKPRGIHGRKTKLDLLLAHGYTINDVKEAPQVIFNISHAKLKVRLSQHQVENMAKPSLYILSQSDNAYRKYLQNRQAEEPEDKQLIVQRVAELLEQPVEYVSEVQEYLISDWNKLKIKIDFLIEKGQDPRAILTCAKVLRLSDSQIQQGYRELEDHHFEDISLPVLYNYITQGNINVAQKSSVVLSEWLILTKGELRTLKKKSYKTALLQSKHVIRHNIDFLFKLGFRLHHIKQVPLLVCHHSSVLERHWDMLENREEFLSLKDQPVLLLNFLQYHIEKEQNFKYPVILTNGD